MKKANYYITMSKDQDWAYDMYRVVRRQEVSGYTLTAKGMDFGITKGEKNFWGITHLETGCLIGSCKYKKDVEAFLDKFDFTEIIKRLEKARDNSYTDIESVKIRESIKVCKTGKPIYKVWKGFSDRYGYHYHESFKNITDETSFEYNFAESLFDENTIIRKEVVA